MTFTGLPSEGFEQRKLITRIVGDRELDEKSKWRIPEATEIGQIAVGYTIYPGHVGIGFQVCSIIPRTDQLDSERKVVASGPHLHPKHPDRKWIDGPKGKTLTHARTGLSLRDAMEITGFVDGIETPATITLFGPQVNELGGLLVRRLERVTTVNAAGRRETAPVYWSRIRATTILREEQGHRERDTRAWWEWDFRVEARLGEPGAPDTEERERGEELAFAERAAARAKGWIVDHEASGEARPHGRTTVTSGRQPSYDDYPEMPPPPTSEADYDYYRSLPPY